MKRYFVIYFAFLLFVCSLCGCMNKENSVNQSSQSTISEVTKEDKTEADSKVPSEKPSEAPSKEPESSSSPDPSKEPEVSQNQDDKKNEEKEETSSTFESYTVKVKYVGNYIFTEPTFDSTQVSPMPIGTFTIVEEATDYEGNLWGKLKSGAGFICLTDIEKEISPVAIGVADKTFLESGKYVSYGVETPDSYPIVIQSTENLTKVTFVTLEIFEGEAGAGDVLMHWEEMAENTFYIMWADFPGDMSAYGVSLTDEEGNFLRYEIYQSGRNGTIQAINPDI